MATYRFIGNNRYFTGICTNDLLFDNKDSSEKRLFCEESTCISAKYSGVMPVTPCRTEMLPAGYTDKIFEWGVEGGPWTTNINYNGRFPSSPNEFIGPGMLTKIKQPLDPTGNFYKFVYDARGRQSLLFNSNAFSNEFDIQDTSSAGYQALGGGGQFQFDPANSIGTQSFEPTRDASNKCMVYAQKYDSPDISYYDVGVDPELPEKHDVVFPKALISGGSPWLDPTSAWTFNPNPPAWVVAFRNAYITPAIPIKAAQGFKCPYSPGNHPPMPPLSAYPEWNYNHVVVNNPGTYATGRAGANSRGAKVYHPLADYQDATKVIRGTTAGPEWHTGYRMQRYKQTANEAKLGAWGNNSHIGFAFRDIETRIKAHGYYAKWTLKSIVPTYFIIQNSLNSGGGNIYHNWSVEAVVTIEVTYHKFNSTLHSVYNYEYGPTLSPDDPNPCGSDNGWSPVFERKVDFALSNCAPILNSPSVSLGSHFVYGYVNLNGFGTKYWEFQYSHAPTTPVSNNPSNALSLKSLKRINYYTLPMRWNSGTYSAFGSSYISPDSDPTYIAYQSQKFGSLSTSPGVRQLPLGDGFFGGTMTTPFPATPNNFKLWRRKV